MTYHNTNLSHGFGDQKTEMGLTEPQSRCWQGSVIPGSCRRESISMCFSASRHFPHSLACGRFHVQSQSHHSGLLSPSLTFLPASFFHLCFHQACLDHPEECFHLKILNLITSAISLLLCKVMCSQVWVLGCGHLWGPFFADHIA